MSRCFICAVDLPKPVWKMSMNGVEFGFVCGECKEYREKLKTVK